MHGIRGPPFPKLFKRPTEVIEAWRLTCSTPPSAVMTAMRPGMVSTMRRKLLSLEEESSSGCVRGSGWGESLNSVTWKGLAGHFDAVSPF